jgi:ribonucleoside-diphosphate reductase alpha chain
MESERLDDPEILDYHIWYDGVGFEFEQIKSFLSNLDKTLLYGLYRDSPYYNSLANDIDVFKKIEMQGKIQKWIDHSISITHNLPKETTEDQVSDIYIHAWKSDCKGCTLYREGSRDGIILNIEREEKGVKNFTYSNSYKRPKRVKCQLHSLQALKKSWIVLVGKVNNIPYEIFAFPKENISNEVYSELINTNSEISLGKRKKKVYDLYIGDSVFNG